MDQPPQQSPLNNINPEGIIATIIGALVTLGGIAVRGRLRLKGVTEKIRAESEPSMQDRSILWANNLIAQYKAEADLVRTQSRLELDRCTATLEKERAERIEYMQRTTTLAVESKQLLEENAELREEIKELKARVAKLERLLRKGHTEEA